MSNGHGPASRGKLLWSLGSRQIPTVLVGLKQEEAAREAWAAPGVHSVENLITVEP